MLQNKYLKEWSNIVSSHFPHLSLPQVTGLATWSFGMVFTGSSSITRVSTFIAKINGEKTNTVRQRLKEWYQDTNRKKGKNRSELDVTQCFAPLLQWILSLWNSKEKWLPLAMDATYIGQSFTVLSIHVLYNGCAIPVAWKIVKGTEKGSWKPLWQELFQSLKNVIPNDWQVIVSADRGLYADWLFEAICDLNWHPFLRINHQGTYQVPGEKQWKSLNQVVQKTAMSWSGLVTCFKTNPLDCTLLARWDKGYKDPWLIVTDLEATQADVRWYGLRSWIECGYRDVKSDGWQWHKTRLREPARAERIWLAMAVATLWVVTMGDEQTQHLPETFKSKQSTIENSQDHCQSKSNPTHRQISCFLQGLINIVAHLICGQSICLHNLFPQSPLLFNSS
jgi:hypothetical protein